MWGRTNRAFAVSFTWNGRTDRASLHCFLCHFADMSAKTGMPKQVRSTPTLDKM